MGKFFERRPHQKGKRRHSKSKWWEDSKGFRPLCWRWLNPFECFRLGLESHAGEYNPVAVLILKCTLEYPQRYGRQNKVKRDEGLLNIEKKESALISDVRKWGEWVLEQARERDRKVLSRR
jgi:adenine-specific DNA methylase